MGRIYDEVRLKAHEQELKEWADTIQKYSINCIKSKLDQIISELLQIKSIVEKLHADK